MRKPLIIGNWKMNPVSTPALGLLQALAKAELSGKVEAVICPPYLMIPQSALILPKTKWSIGAQNVYPADSGAYTGEISAPMLKAAGCQYVLVGHSERRTLLAETDDFVEEKVKAAFANELVSVLCVGESLAIRDAGEATQYVRNQVIHAIGNLTELKPNQIVIAYEPIWAIGTGKNCSAPLANDMIAAIRETCASLFGSQWAKEIRILYGGSVKAGNILDYMLQPEIDGALVGGACLAAEEFLSIIARAEKNYGE
ncbi:MAG: triose-phosphate isomerase [Negativicutes bacterium]|nr:triose-phosphate isomerase [Negativicutes bacterium]